MLTDKEEDPSCYEQAPFVPHQICTPAAQSVTLLRLLETAVGQACHHGFYKREGNPRSESQSDSSKVTSKSVGRPEALPAPAALPE